MKLIRKNNQPDSKENVELLKSDFSRQLWKSMFFALAAVSVIVIASIAWFVSNSRVHSSTASVSADFEPIKLATRGDRQQGEVEHLALAEGNEETYNGKVYYCTEEGTIALRLDGTNHEVSPGSKGKVEFFIIPNGSTSSVTLHIGLGGYGEDEDDNKVKPIEDDVLKALMSGHILLFDNYENGEYSDWLFSSGGSNGSIFNNTITIDLSGKPANVPVPVDFYWIWPLRYENMVNDFEGIQDFINEQAKGENMSNLNEKYRYSRIFLTDKNDLTGAEVDERSKAYDLADEYIGSNAQYLYLTIQISADDNMEGGGSNEKK